MPYTQNDYDKLVEELYATSQERLKKLGDVLIPGSTKKYGISTPDLKAMAKKIAEGDWRGYLKIATNNSYEENVIQAFVIASVKCDMEERLTYVKAFIPTINNWASCDALCMYMKVVRKEQAMVREFIKPYLASKKEFEIRFGAVILLCYFVDDQYIDDTLRTLAKLRTDAYYAMMGVSWAISQCYIRYPEKTYVFLEKGLLSKETQNKSIQKIRESTRVGDEDKERLLALKKK